ncbi:MAG: response regulator transcription factor [Oleiphilaceae bacterium]|nr:response regulator transcription factor [Oleiphilaceae bacterium]
MKVALLEDDPQQAQLVCTWLEQAGLNVAHFPDGKSIVKAFKSELFDIAILDWELPDTTGIEVMRQLRIVQKQTLPILFTTQRDAEEDIVNALTNGADDYLVKPLRQAELLARIEAMRRRAGISSEKDVLTLGNIEINANAQQITVNGEIVKATPKDFGIAWELISNEGQVLSREYLLKKVWGVDAQLNTRTVDMHVSRVRRSLNINPDMGYRITTIFQHGYRLEKVTV